MMQKKGKIRDKVSEIQHFANVVYSVTSTTKD